jgi:hypothetical protein
MRVSGRVVAVGALRRCRVLYSCTAVAPQHNQCRPGQARSAQIRDPYSAAVVRGTLPTTSLRNTRDGGYGPRVGALRACPG